MSDIQEQIKLAHKRAEENDYKKECFKRLEYTEKYSKYNEEDLIEEIIEKDKEIERLNNIIVIMEKYFELIVDLGYDYDGLNSIENLKGLIDELVRYASLGRVYNMTEAIYVNEDKKYNILNEELKEK